MIIRQETPQDFAAIYALVKEGFKTAKVSNGKEQDFVNFLRASGNYIPELALLAEDAAKLIGHIMLTKTSIADGARKHELLLLAPITVALDHRMKGVGARLMAEVFGRAKNLGHRAVILVGDPAFYTKFGFKPAADFGIANTNGIPNQYVLACELTPDALRGANGAITFETGE